VRFIGIDFGSSAIKAAWLDVDTLAIGPVSARPFPAPSMTQKGHCEIDVVAICHAVSQVLDELTSDGKPPAGIVSCCQIGGVVLVDTARRPLTNYLSWRDQRLYEPHSSGRGTFFDVFNERLTPAGLRELGNECKPGSALNLLFWLHENGKLPRHAVPLALGDFIWCALADARPMTHVTSALGAISPVDKAWGYPQFETLQLPSLAWPELAVRVCPVGHLSLGGSRVPCFAAVGDHQCALAGTMLERGELSINVSTGSQVSMISDLGCADGFQVRPYFDEGYLHTVTHLPAGRSLNALVGLLTELGGIHGQEVCNPWPYILDQVARVEHQAREMTGTSRARELCVDLAFYSGPAGEVGSITGATLENLTVGNLFYAALSNMVDNYDRFSRVISPTREWDRIAMSGGLLQKCVTLRDLIAERFKSPYRLCEGAEETLRGLMALAMTISDRAGSVKEATGIIRSRGGIQMQGGSCDD
jgi:sugar (pentulose or hexulose) kinase